MKNILSLFFAIALLTSCSEVPVNIPNTSVELSGKTVLVEELTGVSCPNCPSGAKAVASIAKKYPKNVFPVAIHGRFLCKPITKEGYASKYDFRNEPGRFLENYLKPFLAKPSVYFNRVWKEGDEQFGNSEVGGSWLTRVEEELEKEQVLSIIPQVTYDSDSRSVSLQVSVKALKDLSGNHTISVMILEDNIIDSQKDQQVIVKDYVHKHVLMDMLTEYNGDPLSGNIKKDASFTKTYSYTLPKEDGRWKAGDIQIVVFVSNVTDSKKEVIQTAGVKLVS